MLVILSQEELSQCEAAASKRTNYARSQNIPNQRYSQSKSDLSVDYIGMVGEMAVARVLGLTMDLDRVGVDHGIDFVYRDKTLDVKTTSHPRDRLIFKTKEHFKADAAILAQFKEPNEVTILGSITKNKFVDNCKRIKIWNETKFCVERPCLTPLKNL